MASARAVANRFLELAATEGRTLTPMQVLKLVYIAHGWMLALYGRPMIHDRVEAWQYGPVIPSLYGEMRHFGSGPVNGPLTGRFGGTDPAPDDAELDVVDQVYQLYGHLSGMALSRITHAQDTPWAQTYEPGSFGLIIPTDLIADHYQRLSRERSSGRRQ